MSWVENQIKKLGSQLFPQGRAFKMPFGGDLEKLNNGLAQSEKRAYEDALSILDSALPDNDNFTLSDAQQWYRRLGLAQNDGTLADKKLAIARKMKHPGTVKARQHYLYLQGQLRAAGFDVYVYENRFADGMGGHVTKTAIEVVLAANGVKQLGEFQLGEYELGDYAQSIIRKAANHIDESKDDSFNEGANLRSTFFICGNPVGIFADVSETRKNEFRQLILKLKPVQTVGYLFINYI